MHPILGNIIRNTQACDGLATISYNNGSVSVSIIADESRYDVVVEFAASVVKDLQRIDVKAKQTAASQLTEKYNDGWHTYEVMKEDGTFKAVSNPQLTQDELARKLTLNAISVIGDGDVVKFFYDNDNIFWGHSVTVTVFGKLDFTRADAGIFG